MLIAFLVMGTIVPVVFADGALTVPSFEAIGRISIVSSGVGLNGVDPGTISINVPGTSVIAAYLYWGGHDTGDSAGDDQVTFEGTPITADNSYTDWWYSNQYHYIYVAEVTTHVTTGPADYDVGDFGPLVANYGAGLLVVYRDETLPLSKVTILEGLDSFWFNWLNARGPNSEVTYLDFTKSTFNRDIDITLMVGGTEHDNRPNEIWTKTGAGTKPTNLVDPPSAANGPYPLWAADGVAWDTFTKTVEIPKGHEWLGVQIESIKSWETGLNYQGRGDSAVLIAAGFVLPVEGNGKVTGGGQIVVGAGGKKEVGSFGFNAMWFSRDDGPKGELQYLNHVTDKLVHAHIVDYLIVWEPLEGNKPMPLKKAYFYGPCTVNHEDGYWFELYVEDDGEPKNPDLFDIKVYDINDLDNPIIDNSGPLLHGNIQIHKPPK
ncbi:MAG: DUF3344 domain-containing protein [Candidatus Bathyarchaeota archaeon]